ncbi:MAG: restriction endonuclease subunit S [Ruminococcus sp.]|nr:restriction endonuclease subunit S [Ruminococcus sp.]
MSRIPARSLSADCNSQFIEMFGNPLTNERGWRSALFPEVTDIALGSTPKSSEPAFWDGDISWITPAEIEEDSFIINDSVRHITEAGVKNAGVKPFPEGTVIFTTRAPIGKTAIAGCEMYCNQGFKNFVCHPELNPVYLFSLLRIYKDCFIGLGTGATFKELSKARIEKISISVPPIGLQNEYEAFYRQTDKSKFAVHLTGSNLNLSLCSESQRTARMQ